MRKAAASARVVRRALGPARSLSVLLPLLLATCAAPEPIRPTLHAHTLEARIDPLKVDTAGRDKAVEGIELYNPTGSIHVQNADLPELETRLRVSAESFAAAQAIAKACRVEQRFDKGWLYVEFWPPDGVPIERIGIHFTLKVPPGSKLRLRSRQGLIDTTTARLRSLDLQTQGGRLRTGPVKDLLDFINRSGKTVIHGPFAQAKGWSASGELLVRNFPREGKLVFSSNRGKATLFIKKDEPIFIDYETVTGKLVTDLSFSRESSITARGKRETIKFNGGAECCQIVLQLDSGSLELWAD